MSQKPVNVPSGLGAEFFPSSDADNGADQSAIESGGSSPVIPHAIIHHRHLSGGPGVGPGTASPGRYSATQAQQLAQRMAQQEQAQRDGRLLLLPQTSSTRSRPFPFCLGAFRIEEAVRWYSRLVIRIAKTLFSIAAWPV